MVSYNYCPFIVELYKEFYIFYTTRPNSMSQTAGSEYEEIVITNYDPRRHNSARQLFGQSTDSTRNTSPLIWHSCGQPLVKQSV